MKKSRHQKIIDLVQHTRIATQEELADILNQEGYKVTQATVSRDIKELKLSKVPGPGGVQYYQLLEPEEQAYSDKYIRVVREALMSMDTAGNLLVIRTMSGMANAVAAALDHYMENNEYDEEDFELVTERLDYIRSIMMKYGGTVAKVEDTLVAKKQRLAELEDYDAARSRCEKAVAKAESVLRARCAELTKARERGAKQLSERIRQELSEMGFLDIRFELPLTALKEPGANGMDEAHFVVSLNPGEPLRPLSEVASGGELSRIMLSIKTVLADSDEIPTLIFDEIDTGISGRTAEKVSEKLRKIAQLHQVILITHLPQIAAKADQHFCIEKSVADGHTHTRIHALSEEDSVLELARLLAGGQITEAVLANARELKKLART